MKGERLPGQRRYGGEQDRKRRLSVRVISSYASYLFGDPGGRPSGPQASAGDGALRADVGRCMGEGCSG